MNDFQKNIRFKKNERIALIFLLLLVLVLYSIKYLKGPQLEPFESTRTLEEIITECEDHDDEAKQKLLEKVESFKTTYAPKPKSVSKPKIILKKFDPNTIDSSQLKQFILKPWVYKNFLNYRMKGGQFYNCEELKKIYGMDKEDFEKLSPYCILNDPPLRKKKNTFSANIKKRNITPIQVNNASAEQFATIKGIGPKLSERIIKFRDRLGGFHSVEQLKEVYGIEASLIDNNKAVLILDGELNKLNINGDYKTLVSHPYLKNENVRMILAYRKQHGPFTDLEQLNNLRALPKDIIERILPYLEL